MSEAPSNTVIHFFFCLSHSQESSLLSTNPRQSSLNRANIHRTCWEKLFGPWIYLCRSSTNTPNYIRKAKVCPIKNQLYSPNTPNYVREQMFAQLRTGLRDKKKRKEKNTLTNKQKPVTLHDSWNPLMWPAVGLSKRWWHNCWSPTWVSPSEVKPRVSLHIQT